MPNRSCLTPQCAGVSGRSGYCPRCTHTRNQARRPTSRIYESKLHRHWRSVILTRDPICRMCNAAPSVVADHRIPLRQGGTWSYDNGQGLCKRCDGVKGMPERLGGNRGANLYEGGSSPVSGKAIHAPTYPVGSEFGV
jgi:5-methylcytosine-specific restriction enzyme A